MLGTRVKHLVAQPEPAARRTEGEAMTGSVAQKMGVREGSRAYFDNAPSSAIAAIALPSCMPARA